MEKEISQLRALANSAQYKKAYLLAKKFREQFPRELIFIYFEAVMFGDDELNRTMGTVLRRHRKAAEMLRPLLERLNELPQAYRFSVKNEYFWFSHQPMKQYRLGINGVKNKNKRSGHYSKGVGAVEIAKLHFKNGRNALGIKWSQIAEAAWLEFFKIDKNWYNAYCWYGKALAYQRKVSEMNRALKTAAKISGKPINDFEFEEVRKLIGKQIKFK